MYFTVEQWTPKQTWLDLAASERQAFMESLGPVMQKHAEMGIEILMMGSNDADTDRKSKYGYFSVIRAPDEAAAKTFEKDVREAGWYDYFEQENARGKARSPEDVIGEHIAL